MFDKYINTALFDAMKMKFKKITPIPENSHIQMLCYLLECLLTKEHNVQADSPKEVIELFFVFAAVWAFGGCL